MKHVRLIRHGESAANAGAATQDHASIPLTARGVEQAGQVARSFTLAPELIIVSPFSRAQATASATAAAFASATLQTWPVEEFTYLEPARCVNTTVADRRRWVEQYWARAEPGYIDGPGAESFNGFVSRAQAFLDRLADNHAGQVAVFSHGQFINAVAWLIQRQPHRLDGDAMADWRAYEIANPVKNAWGYQLLMQPDSTRWTLAHKMSPEGIAQI